MPTLTPLSELEALALAKDAEWSILEQYVSSFEMGDTNYFAGNSLGLEPKGFKEKLLKHASIWNDEQHNGHFFTDDTDHDRPWWKYQEKLVSTAARLLGAMPNPHCPEVAIFNTLSVNNRNLIETFAMYIRGTTREHIVPTILTIQSNFPSDDVGLKYALRVVFGKNHKLVEIVPDANGLYNFDRLVETIKSEPNVDMGFFPGLCFATGQRFPIKRITDALHERGAIAGFDLAHSMGNYQLHMHDDEVDFATFCGYKYLNGGPGSVGGIFIHQKWFSEHGFKNPADYVSGWFGIHMDDRFNFIPNNYRAAPGAWGFIQSNDQIFNMQGLETSLELIEKYDMHAIFKKHEEISTFMYDCLDAIPGVSIITPRPYSERGCQISFRVENEDTEKLVEELCKQGNFCERRGNFIRVAPVAYNMFLEVWLFCTCLKRIML